MRILLFLLVAVFPLNSWGIFQKIWMGYQASNFNQSQHLDLKINEANYLFELNKFDWQLQISPSYEILFGMLCLLFNPKIQLRIH